MKVAFIGLGVMGFPMAGHLEAAGHEVSVFNRSPEKARRWASQHGGRAGSSIAETVAGCEVVALCVGNDDDVRQVVDEALPAMAESGIIVDHTTASARLAREAADQARAAGRWFVDAPVSAPEHLAKCTASARPCSVPAMQIWLTILASWPEPGPPIRRIALA